jgi:hypothetical protein
MASQIYCQDCGAPTQYSIKIPIFCCSCGQPFNKTVKAAAPSVIPPNVLAKNKKRRVIEEPIEEEDDDDDNIDDDGNEDYGFEDDSSGSGATVSEAELNDNVEIEVRRPRKLKIEDIARGDEGSGPVPFKGSKAPKVSKKAFQQQWEKEAGTLRKGNK